MARLLERLKEVANVSQLPGVWGHLARRSPVAPARVTGEGHLPCQEQPCGPCEGPSHGHRAGPSPGHQASGGHARHAGHRHLRWERGVRGDGGHRVGRDKRLGGQVRQRRLLGEG